jgi:hypothetical protein
LSAKPVINKEAKEVLRRAILTSGHRYNALNIVESPLCQLLLSQHLPSTLSRNHYLEQSLAKLLRDNGLSPDDIPELIHKINVVQSKEIQVDPDYLADEDYFNPETVNAYCIGCMIPLVYELMPEIPEIPEAYSSEQAENLDKYSFSTIEKMSINGDFKIKKPYSYFDLKMLIRNLVDRYDRASVFFTMKKLLYNDWSYFSKNGIIIKILNKTRKKDESS